MNTLTRLFVGTVAALALCLTVSARETEEKTPHPGYRPESALASEFIRTVNTATVRVYPTIIRTPTDTFHSTESQQQIVDFLNGKKITKAIPDDRPIDPGELKGRGQFDWFQSDSTVIGEAVQKQKIGEKYMLVVEVLFPPQRGKNQTVFGIHCIILDAEGQSVFSFLLNSHHQLFIDAAMHVEEGTTETRAALVSQATAVGMEALLQQLKIALPKQG